MKMFDTENIAIEVANFAAFTNKHGNRYLKRFVDNRVAYLLKTVEELENFQKNNVRTFFMDEREYELHSSCKRTFEQIYSKLKTYGFSYEALREYHDGRIEVDYVRHYLYI